VAFWRDAANGVIVDAVGGNDAVLAGDAVVDGDLVRYAVDSGFAVADDCPEYSVDATGELTICWAQRVDTAFNSAYIYSIGKGDANDYEWGIRNYDLSQPKGGQMSLYSWNLDGGLGSGAGVRDDGSSGDPFGLDYWCAVLTNHTVYGPQNEHNNFNPQGYLGKCVLYRNGNVQPTGAPGNFQSQYGVTPQNGGAGVFQGRRGVSDVHWGGVSVGKLAIFGRELDGVTIKRLSDSFHGS